MRLGCLPSVENFVARCVGLDFVTEFEVFRVDGEIVLSRECRELLKARGRLEFLELLNVLREAFRILEGEKVDEYGAGLELLAEHQPV